MNLETNPDGGFLIVLSGPSGSGKEAAIQGLHVEFPGLYRHLTYTTRKPRDEDEVKARQRLFTTPEGFQELIRTGALLEWEQVHGTDWYGCPSEPLLTNLKSGMGCALELDVRGHAALRRHGKFLRERMVSFFIRVPIEDLEARMRKREPEIAESVLNRRLDTAIAEQNRASEYDFIVDNRDGALAEAVKVIARYARYRTSERIAGRVAV